jgi:hypothetical protein
VVSERWRPRRDLALCAPLLLSCFSVLRAAMRVAMRAGLPVLCLPACTPASTTLFGQHTTRTHTIVQALMGCVTVLSVACSQRSNRCRM